MQTLSANEARDESLGVCAADASGIRKKFSKPFVDDLIKQLAHLEWQLGRYATIEEVATSLGADAAAYRRALEEVYPLPLAEYVSAWKGCDPLSSDKAFYAYIFEKLVQTMDALDDKTRIVITLFFYEGLNSREIAMVVGIAESEVCQIHSHAMLTFISKLETVM